MSISWKQSLQGMLGKFIAKRQRQFTLAQLAQYNGLNGQPAYVAISGKVYDVTQVPYWAQGKHFGLQAGQDWTAQFVDCHIDQSILRNLPVVGVLAS